MGVIRNYGDLYIEVADLLARNDLTGKIPGWLDEVQKELVRDIKHLTEIRYRLSGQPLLAGATSLETPDGTSRVFGIELDLSPPQRLNIVSLDKLTDVKAGAQYSGLEYPSAMHILDQNTILIEPAVSAAVDYTITYAATTMGDVDENLITSQVLEEAPDVLKYGIAIHAAAFTRNAEAGAAWMALYESKVQKYAIKEFRKATDGGVLRVRPSVIPEDTHTLTYTR